MWLLNFLPDWFFHLITLLGIGGIVASFFLGMVPFISKYKLPLQVISIVLLVGGIYMEGAMSNEEKWQLMVKEMEDKVKEAEIKSMEVNQALEATILEKTSVIKEKGKTRVEYINRLVEGRTVEIVKDMSAEEKQAFMIKQKELQDALKNCPVPRIIVEEHNKVVEQK
jgi:hypothetical protein